jgi:uncharacterized protein (DUF3820 family)
MYNSLVRISDKGDMQFGYYIGRHISKLPAIYLQWIVQHLEVENEHDVKMVDWATLELDARGISV